MNVTDPAKFARDANFRDRALIAALREAIAVLQEPATTPNHTFRIGYAQSILKGPEQYQDAVAWVLASAPQLAGLGPVADAVPDDVLGQVLHELWDALSMPSNR